MFAFYETNYDLNNNRISLIIPTFGHRYCFKIIVISDPVGIESKYYQHMTHNESSNSAGSAKQNFPGKKANSSD